MSHPTFPNEEYPHALATIFPQSSREAVQEVLHFKALLDITGAANQLVQGKGGELTLYTQQPLNDFVSANIEDVFAPIDHSMGFVKDLMKERLHRLGFNRHWCFRFDPEKNCVMLSISISLKESVAPDGKPMPPLSVGAQFELLRGLGEHIGDLGNGLKWEARREGNSAMLELPLDARLKKNTQKMYETLAGAEPIAEVGGAGQWQDKVDPKRTGRGSDLVINS